MLDLNCLVDFLREDPTDRGGNTYKTVIINDQVWMAENMRYPSGTYYHVNDSANNDDAYGLLYTRVSAGSICPTDWRLPSKDDVDKLLAYVDENKTSTSVFLALIAKSPAWGDYESMAGDEFGFGALPNGYRSQNGSFSEFGQTAYWWLADEQNSTGTYIHTFKIDPIGGLSISSDNLNAGLAVRCVKED